MDRVYIMGRKGSGKTLVGAAVVRALEAKGLNVVLKEDGKFRKNPEGASVSVETETTEQPEVTCTIETDDNDSQGILESIDEVLRLYRSGTSQ